MLTILFISIQLLLSSNINIIQFLSLSFEGPAKWIFLGYIFYMILIVAIATTAVFYNHFEVNMHRGIQGIRLILAWIHLLGMNIGGATVTLTIASAGLIGFGVIGTILSGGNITEVKPNTQILEQFIIPISIFAAGGERGTQRQAMILCVDEKPAVAIEHRPRASEHHGPAERPGIGREGLCIFQQSGFDRRVGYLRKAGVQWQGFGS